LDGPGQLVLGQPLQGVPVWLAPFVRIDLAGVHHLQVAQLQGLQVKVQAVADQNVLRRDDLLQLGVDVVQGRGDEAQVTLSDAAEPAN